MRRIGYNKREAKYLQQTIFEYLQQPQATTHDVNKIIRDFAERKPTERPAIVFTDKAINMIKELVRQCDKEIAWNCTVTRKGNTYRVKDVVMFPQVVTATSVDVDETKYANWLASLPEATFNELRFHGHSHVNMGVTPSGIDTKYQADMLPNIKDFYIYMIFNKRGEMYACIWDVEHKTFYDINDIDIVFNTPCKAEAQELIKEYVVFPQYKAQTTTRSGWERYAAARFPEPYTAHTPQRYTGMTNKEVEDYVDCMLGGNANDRN